MTMLLTFGVQLFMYATPIIYPVSSISAQYRTYIELNPLTAIVECFRYAYLGVGDFNGYMMLYSAVVIAILLAIGTLVFNRVQKGFMDTI